MLAILILYLVGAVLTLYWFERRAAIPLPRGVTIASSCAWPVFWVFEWTMRVVDWDLRRPPFDPTWPAYERYMKELQGE